MTQLIEKKVKCCVCGVKNKFTVVKSTNTLSLPDLDTRPAEMKRSTMFAWLQRCPKCGYCAFDVSSQQEGVKLIVTSIEYQRQLEDSTFPELANSFLCRAMIDSKCKDYVAAAGALAAAAWVCDDSGHANQAIVCRKRAVDMIAIAEEHDQQVSQEEGVRTLILSDLLRRSGQFEQAREVIDKQRGSISDNDIVKILDFQNSLVEKQDTSCHNMDEALR